MVGFGRGPLPGKVGPMPGNMPSAPRPQYPGKPAMVGNAPPPVRPQYPGKPTMPGNMPAPMPAARPQYPGKPTMPGNMPAEPRPQYPGKPMPFRKGGLIKKSPMTAGAGGGLGRIEKSNAAAKPKKGFK